MSDEEEAQSSVFSFHRDGPNLVSFQLLDAITLNVFKQMSG